ncbi:MAG: hypothetical protein WAO58_00330 [Fimbriimonadaceae bacterium]
MRVLPLLTLFLGTSAGVIAQTGSGPESEFLAGKTKSYSTKGHSKAKGAIVSIKYPASWKASEGERPNIVQKLISKNGKGLEMVIIIAKAIPAGPAPTGAEINDLMTESSQRTLLPPGAKFIRATRTKIEGDPAAIMEFSMRHERAGTTLHGHVLQLFFLERRALVMIQFSTGGLISDASEMDARATRFSKLFHLMMNSIIFPNKWK